MMLPNSPSLSLLRHWSEAIAPADLNRVARDLAQSGPAGADILLESLADTNPDRIAAALDYLPFSVADRGLVIASTLPFLTHPAASVRASAIDALRHLGAAEVVPLIPTPLEDPEWLVQNAALSYLVWHDPQAGITEAVSRLKDHNPRIREHAMDIVNEREETGAADDLWDVILPLIGDSDPVVRAAARTYLLKRLPHALPDQSNLPHSEVDWLRAVHAAAQANSDGPVAIRLYATDPAPLVRLNLVESLALWTNRVQCERAVTELPQVVAALQRDPEFAVRQAALDLPDFW